MKRVRSSLLAIVALAGFASASAAQQSSASAKPSIVLVHGAFADASAWSRVIPILERDGYYVIAVENALQSLADDIATTRRAIDALKGPVVAVGHSYGGAVISGAAAGAANVKALVFIAALAPEANEPVNAFLDKYPAPLGKALRPDAGGYLYIDRAMLHDVFARDVSAAEARVMAATQKPINGAAFTATIPNAAWKTIPSWYLVAREDRAINPELERFFAKRMNAHTVEVTSSHVPFLSHPKVVAKLIEEAARAVANRWVGGAEPVTRIGL